MYITYSTGSDEVCGQVMETYTGVNFLHFGLHFDSVINKKRMIVSEGGYAGQQQNCWIRI